MRREIDTLVDYRFVIMEVRDTGHLNGYVGIPKSHVLYGGDYNDHTDLGDVHGGLTYSGDCAPGKEPDGYWYYGFDCAHADDLLPNIPAILQVAIPGATWKDRYFVMAEIGKLVEALMMMDDQSVKAMG